MTAPRLRDPGELRRHLHRHPETAHREKRTAETIARQLTSSGADRVVQGVGGTGVVGVFDGRSPGPTVALRAELDALPIAEAGDRPHRSREPGCGHLCGHDGHMAILAAVAEGLAERPPTHGRLALVFQPAEETGEGARSVVADPTWRSLAVDWVFALHNLPGIPLGRVVVREGTFACGSVGVEAHLLGTTSHAAHPELGRSPAAAVARLIHRLGGLAERVGGPGFRLSTVVHARLGSPAFGTTPGEAVVGATLRAETAEALDGLRSEAERALREEAAAAGLGVEVAWREPFPVTANHHEACAVIRAAARGCGLELDELAEPLRWSEDFGWFTAECRGALFGLGAGTDQPPLHAPEYDFPDALVAPAARLMRGIVDRVLDEVG